MPKGRPLDYIAEGKDAGTLSDQKVHINLSKELHKGETHNEEMLKKDRESSDRDRDS